MPPGSSGVSPPNYFKTLGRRIKKTKKGQTTPMTSAAVSRRGSSTNQHQYNAPYKNPIVNSNSKQLVKPARMQIPQKRNSIITKPTSKRNLHAGSSMNPNFGSTMSNRSTTTYHQPTIQVGYKHNWNHRRQRKTNRPAPAIEMLGASPNLTQLYTHPKVKHNRNNNSLFAPSYRSANLDNYDTFLPLI